MRAGRLRHRVDLVAPNISTDAYGDAVPSPTAYAVRVPAMVRMLTGNERWNAQQVQAELSYEVQIRHRDDVKPSHRVLWGDRTLEIMAVTEDEKQRECLLLCAETT